MPNIPHSDARRIVIELVDDLLRNVHQSYYPSMTFAEAVATQVICGEIIHAEIVGAKINTQMIAARVQVPRRTLDRRINYLIKNGIIRRDGDGLHYNGTQYRDDAIKASIKLIITAANKLLPLAKMAVAKVAKRTRRTR